MDGHTAVMQDPQNPLWRFDIAVQRAVRDSSVQASPAVRETVKVINWWGGPGVIWFGAALWLGGRALRRHAAAKAGLRGIEGLAIASAISGIIKGLAGRSRPFLAPGEPWHWDFNHGWSDARFFSMPSGHTTATVAFAVAVLLATWSWTPGKRFALALPVLISGAFVAASRMIANQHWATDVIVAIGLGTLTSIGLARLHARRQPSNYDRVMLGGAAMTAPAPAVKS
jgi:membrane-associated phospholipid phosphatase